MSDNKSPRGPSIRKPPDGAAEDRAPNAGLSGRNERGPPPPRPPARPGVSRHAAITRTLQNYASYKLWAEKIRSSWEPGKYPKG